MFLDMPGPKNFLGPFTRADMVGRLCMPMNGMKQVTRYGQGRVLTPGPALLRKLAAAAAAAAASGMLAPQAELCCSERSLNEQSHHQSTCSQCCSISDALRRARTALQPGSRKLPWLSFSFCWQMVIRSRTPQQLAISPCPPSHSSRPSPTPPISPLLRWHQRHLATCGRAKCRPA